MKNRQDRQRVKTIRLYGRTYLLWGKTYNSRRTSTTLRIGQTTSAEIFTISQQVLLTQFVPRDNTKYVWHSLFVPFRRVFVSSVVLSRRHFEGGRIRWLDGLRITIDLWLLSDFCSTELPNLPRTPIGHIIISLLKISDRKKKKKTSEKKQWATVERGALSIRYGGWLRGEWRHEVKWSAARQKHQLRHAPLQSTTGSSMRCSGHRHYLYPTGRLHGLEKRWITVVAS